MPLLDQIIESKKNYLQKAKTILPLAEIKQRLKENPVTTSRFLNNIQNSELEVKIIGEIKRNSPSVGKILDDKENILDIARIYHANGIVALSILTENNFFNGDVTDLKMITNSIDLPVLRKDFIIEDYQVYESKLYGADAILLIVRILDDISLKRFTEIADQLYLDIIYEVHSQEELERILPLNPKIVGINNRDLDSLEIDFKVSESILPQLSEEIVKIVESGIRNYQDIVYFKSLGADAFLIGETILKSEDRADKIRELMGYG